ncbi:MAG: hypothetical protein CMI53_00650 [Parcubacteria group bacterium]|jgi:hypothetical protein|nr:hypothetical protein [Parcubacteria group bacterium]|tara:strand:+ start:4089 stop:5225 length:1137 start_codon:yes stop_codon:yes gene_type:complete
MLPRSFLKIGLIFLILSIVVFGAAFYLIWAKVTIIITMDSEKISREFVFDVKEPTIIPSLEEGEAVPGKLKLVVVEGDLSTEATGSRSVDSNVVGEVVITNDYSKEQKLITTTRLAAADDPDTVLVRLNKDITVAPGEKIKVQVYADDYDAFKKIEPTRLIIPGLWGPLQEKIYAQVESSLDKIDIEVAVVTQEDLDKAENDLRDQLYQKALSEVNQQLENHETLWPKLVSAKVIESGHDTEVNEEAAEFKTTLKIEAAIVVFDESKLINLARERIKTEMPEEQQLIDLDPTSFSYLVESYSFESNEATVKVNLEANSIGSDTSGFLDKSLLTGKTEEEIKSYFSQFPQVKSVEVRFQPVWLKKTPQFQGKIKVEIAQ